MDAKTERMKELVELLNQASKAYYQQDTEIMSNLEYDALYDELAALEQETGLILSKSPTQNVGYEIISELPKERHPAPMLSLDKTKSVEDLAAWLGDKTGVMSWKMDGLTVVLTYEDGVLVKAVTRGNGEIGEVITNNAKVFANLPNQIAYKGPLTIRGEAVITYTDFERINATIPDIDSKYKNPRNLCSGSVRQLNNQITAERNVHFFAFNMLDTGDAEIDATMNSKFDFLTSLGLRLWNMSMSQQQRCRRWSHILQRKSRRTISHLMDSCFRLMMWNMVKVLDGQRNSRGIRSHLNGQTRKRRQRFGILSGVRPVPG